MTDSDAHLAALPDGDGNVRMLIRPNRSLSPQETLPLFLAASAVLATIGVGFALLGAWPVLPFTGLELVIIGAVLRSMHHHHGDCEMVIVTGDRVRVHRRCGRLESEAEFSRHWARVAVTPSRGMGQPMQVRIGSHGRFVPIGAGVREEDRRRLVQELKAMLARDGR